MEYVDGETGTVLVTQTGKGGSISQLTWDDRSGKQVRPRPQTAVAGKVDSAERTVFPRWPMRICLE
jgi:hypothetical protein